jgi:hypothetical protein
VVRLFSLLWCAMYISTNTEWPMLNVKYSSRRGYSDKADGHSGRIQRRARAVCCRKGSRSWGLNVCLLEIHINNRYTKISRDSRIEEYMSRFNLVVSAFIYVRDYAALYAQVSFHTSQRSI